MNRSFLKRVALQLTVPGGQVLALAMFVTYLPRLDADPQSWAAEYFLAIAITTPIFVLFSFELRKLTVVTSDEASVQCHRLRLKGVALAVGISMVTLVPLAWADVVRRPGIYLAVIAYRTVMNVHDQACAEYERTDRFEALAASGVAKTAAFVGAVLLLGPTIGSTEAVVFGAALFAIVMIVVDGRHRVLAPTWLRGNAASFTRDRWATGVGSFLVSTTLNAPRGVAAVILGEAAVIVMGVGQSLNRVGQMMSGSLVQTFLSLRNRNTEARASLEIVRVFQVVGFLALVALLPIWTRVFDYAADLPDFTVTLMLVLGFGLVSQVNYLYQSVLLVDEDITSFVVGPVLFLVVFALSTMVLLLLGGTVIGFVIVMIGARLVQLVFNMRRYQAVA